jgi:hypothetical protein
MHQICIYVASKSNQDIHIQIRQILVLDYCNVQEIKKHVYTKFTKENFEEHFEDVLFSSECGLLQNKYMIEDVAHKLSR